MVLTALSGVLLTNPMVSAEESFIDSMSVSVPMSCSLTSVGTNSHSEQINNGQTVENIGTTTVKIFCNDNSGWALYAIGYTDDEYGKNVLVNSALSNSFDIATAATVTTGTSSWAMKLTKTGNSYVPIIAGSTEDTNKQTGDPNFSAFAAVPNAYAKVAYYLSSTDLGTNASGSNLTTTYKAYLSQTQPAGTYVGQVKYTLVHPSTAATPIAPDPPSSTCSTEVPGVTYMQEITASNRVTILSGMTTGTRYHLSDSRDGKTYCVGKLADGNLWMLDNLALDIVSISLSTLKGRTNASDTTLEYLKGTHVRGDGSFVSDDNYPTAAVGYFDSDGYYSVPKIAISGDCYNAYCVNDPESGKWTSSSITQATINSTNSNAQGIIGVYYNYCAVSAGSYCFGNNTSDTGSPSSDPDTNTIQDVTEDICPSGWRLPTSDTGGEYASLYAQYIGGTPSQVVAFQVALSTPLSGGFNSGKASLQGGNGFFWSSTWAGAGEMKGLQIYSGAVSPSSNGGWRSNGSSARCILDS